MPVYSLEILCSCSPNDPEIVVNIRTSCNGLASLPHREHGRAFAEMIMAQLRISDEHVASGRDFDDAGNMRQQWASVVAHGILRYLVENGSLQDEDADETASRAYNALIDIAYNGCADAE